MPNGAEPGISLTPLQERLATASWSRVVLLGGPSTGKSRLLAERALWLLQNGRARPEQVHILAPSRRAARAVGNMVRDRLAGARAPYDTSFHGLAMTILRRHYRAMGYRRPPKVLNTYSLFHLLGRLLAEEDPSKWPRYARSLGGDALQRLAYDTVMGAAENGLATADLQLRAALSSLPTPLVELADFYERYRMYLIQAGLIDFGQLLARAAELLASDRKVAESYRSVYRHLLVDEFEDANYIQAELLRQLVGPETDLLIVGDPAQAINSYRSGSPCYLLECAKRLGASVVCSNERHGYGPRLLSLGQALRPVNIVPGQTVESAAGPNDLSDLPDDGLDCVVMQPFVYLVDEARWIGVEVARRLREGARPDDIAILLRATDTPLAKLIRAELSRRGIPICQSSSSEVAMREPLLRATVDLVRYLAGGEGRNASLIRLLDSPLGGLPAFGLSELRRAAALSSRGMVDLLSSDLSTLTLSPSVRLSLEALQERLAWLEDKVGWSMASLLWEIWRLFPAFAADALCGGLASRRYASLINEVAVLEEGRPFLSPAELLERLSAGDFNWVGPPQARREGVLLTTIHQAKGRHWPVVFVPGLVEGAFPMAHSPLNVVAPLLWRDLDRNGGRNAETSIKARHIEEERRILYLAVSRTRQVLCLSYSRYGADGTTIEKPSRFLDLIRGCPAIGEVPAEDSERRPLDIDGAVMYYRRLLAQAHAVRRAEGLYALAQIRRKWPNAVRPEEWWENVEETAGAAPAFPSARLYLSASRLNRYRECPLAYEFNYHWQLLQPSGSPAIIGNILHGVLQEYHRPGAALPRGRDVLARLLEEHFDESRFRYRPIARQARRMLEKLLDLYYARYGTQGPALLVEAPFRFAFGPHTITGRIDRVDRLPDGTLELIDYKSGSAMTFAQAEKDIQLAIYDLAFYEDPSLGALGRPTRAAYLYLKYISSKRADGKRHLIPSEEGRESLRTKIAYYAKVILNERFPSHFEKATAFADMEPIELQTIMEKNPCRVCSFGWICPALDSGAAAPEGLFEGNGS